MSKTVLEISKEIGVSKTAVRNKMKTLFAESGANFAQTVSGTVYINEQGEKLLKSAFTSKTENQFAESSANFARSSREQSETSLHPDSPEVSATTAAIEALRQQLEEKDRQIAALHRLLEQQNGLALADKKAILQLSGEQTGDDQPPEEPPTATTEPDKSGFFDRLRELFK